MAAVPAGFIASSSSDADADAEALQAALKLSTARVRRLAAAVEAEEGALVQAALAEAEVAAVVNSSGAGARAAKNAEQRLHTRVGQSKQLLQTERKKLQDALRSDGDNARRQQLALAVEQGVDEYYSDVRAMRRERREVAGAASGAAQPGSMLRRLREEERRLDDAVRSLRAEIDALEVDEEAAVDQRRALVKALRKRERDQR